MDRKRRFLLHLLLLLSAVGAGTACGPVQYLTSTTSRASKAVAAAKAVEANRFAPYEYYSAVEYLHKSREEAGSANFQAAVALGRQAEAFAKKAHDLAKRRRGGGGPTDEPPLAAERRREGER